MSEAGADAALVIRHPGGVGDILQSADAGGWLRGVIQESSDSTAELQFVAIA